MLKNWETPGLIFQMSYELTSTNYYTPPGGAKFISKEVPSCCHDTEVRFFPLGPILNNVHIDVRITSYILASFKPSLISYFTYGVEAA